MFQHGIWHLQWHQYHPVTTQKGQFTPLGSRRMLARIWAKKNLACVLYLNCEVKFMVDGAQIICNFSSSLQIWRILLSTRVTKSRTEWKSYYCISYDKNLLSPLGLHRRNGDVPPIVWQPVYLPNAGQSQQQPMTNLVPRIKALQKEHQSSAS